jgi:hypothetical protein
MALREMFERLRLAETPAEIALTAGSITRK